MAGQPRSIHSKTKNGFTFPEFHSLGMAASLKKNHVDIEHLHKIILNEDTLSKKCMLTSKI